ncbi:hypothetical protein PW5551_01585 [Petrotoga sp. 9PW.55.5.1]|uniref:hypothetical protein n=1 Tax=Petrotoga sp. 9PW.55.5.1 TaxID=1308979 RepID=UPI000DC5EDE2|nr:hypothetical protein [Petrotoga sp. 9PW.55.5.1]RAO99751.1 hypothetical protein PW5551_01585 [Petrotoga sp. 9PW.55.5.1]
MKRFYLVFTLIAASMLLVTSCALQEVEIKTSPKLQIPILYEESIAMEDLFDFKEIEDNLKSIFENATVKKTTSDSDNLAYEVDMQVFNGEEILGKLPVSDFNDISAWISASSDSTTLTLIVPSDPATIASFPEGGLGIFDDIELESLLVKLETRNATNVTIEATLTAKDNPVPVHLSSDSEDPTDIADLFNSQEVIVISDMDITFNEGFVAGDDTTINLLFTLPFKFTISQEVELYSNEDDIGNEDIFGRSQDSEDDILSDIFDGIESLKLYMDYKNNTGLSLKLSVQGWDVDEENPLGDPVVKTISTGQKEGEVLDLTGFINDIKNKIPYNLLFSIRLPDGTYALNTEGSLEVSLWIDLVTDITIPISLTAE